MNKLTLPPKENNPNFHTNPEQKSEELIVFIKIENNVLARSKLTHKKNTKGKINIETKILICTQIYNGTTIERSRN